MHFPLASLELGRMARRKALYGWRTAILAAALGMMILAEPGPLWVGRLLAQLATFLQYSAVLLIAPLLTARAIAEEKEERTLGILLLADFRGWDIFLAKVLPPFLAVESILLSTLPLLAFAAIYGGISVPHAAGAVAFLSACALAACCLGVWCSTAADTPRRALAWTLLVLWLLAVLLLVGNYGGAGPGFTSGGLPVAVNAGALGPAVFAAPLAAAAVCAGAAIRRLPRCACDGGRPPRTWLDTTRPRRPIAADPAVATASFMRAAAGSGGLGVMAVAFVMAGMVAAPLLFCVGAGWLLLVILILSDMALAIAAIHRSGAPGELAATPLPDDTLVRGLYGAVIGRTWIYAVALFIALGLPGLLVELDLLPPPFTALRSLVVMANGVGAFILFVVCVYQARFLCAMACNSSVVNRSSLPAQAAEATMSVVALHIVLVLVSVTGVYILAHLARSVVSALLGSGDPEAIPVPEEVYVFAVALILLSYSVLGGWIWMYTLMMEGFIQGAAMHVRASFSRPIP